MHPEIASATPFLCSKMELKWEEKERPAGFDDFCFDLPDELLLEIFSKLSFQFNSWFNLLLVSKKWNCIGKSILNEENGDPLFQFFRSIKRGNYSIVLKCLEEKTMDPSLFNHSALMYAASKGYTELVKKILQHPNSNPNARDGEAMRLACKGGHINTVMILISDGRTFGHLEGLRLAWRNKHIDIVELLLKSGKVKRRNLGRKMRWKMNFYHFWDYFSFFYSGESFDLWTKGFQEISH
eukprot:TRINITY_DN9246_c0_g1_i1.p1 TRINITY_DN9246_c0_g1~~TRINITY_DN9246_c0_g1_i1.p1  ORF type:complete len:239 (-),score=78.73 TRINITY_DN9246_c0_g1_i1:481-1197(-)